MLLILIYDFYVPNIDLVKNKIFINIIFFDKVGYLR